MMRMLFGHPTNPFAKTQLAKCISASCEIFESVTRRYPKPDWEIDSTKIDGQHVPVRVEVVWERPFCKLVHFNRVLPRQQKSQPKILLLAPMSGHFATLLRDTVRAFLPHAEVYISDWADARFVPLAAGNFDLETYVDYLISMMAALGSDTHVVAVCQATVPTLVAIAQMETSNSPHVPRTMMLIGGPIDTRVSPTAVNKLAKERGLDWFRRNAIVEIPFGYPGSARRVYPGFLQIGAFLGMNAGRHVRAHQELFKDIVRGDDQSAEKRRQFYNEYFAFMDLTAEFYLQTLERVFVGHALPEGHITHRGSPVDLSTIRRVALFTIEGEHDDICGLGQTEAAHSLCTGIPQTKKMHHVQPGVGHYGIFSGTTFRQQILPRILEFITLHSNVAPIFHPRRSAMHNKWVRLPRNFAFGWRRAAAALLSLVT
jgi:poly(3-hydroxybutyrate) depolymerase